MASPWAHSLCVFLIPNSIDEVLPRLNHLLTRRQRETPSKSFLNANNRLCGGCPIAAFWFAVFLAFPRSHVSAFCLSALQEKFYKCLLCKMHSLHIKNCGKRLWPCHPEALSCFPFTLRQYQLSDWKVLLLKANRFLLRRNAFSVLTPLPQVQSTQRLPGKGSNVPSTESSIAFLYCCWLRGSNYSIQL